MTTENPSNESNSIYKFFKKIYDFIEQHNTFSCLITITICYIILSLIVIFNKPFDIPNNLSYPIYSILTTISIFLLLSIYNFYLHKYGKELQENKDNYSKFDYFYKSYKNLLFGFIVVFAIYIMILLFKHLSSYANVSLIITLFLNFFIISGIIYFFYRWAKNNEKIQIFLKENDLIRLLYNIIIIIPCLLFESINYLYNDIKNTKKYVFIILLIELFIILSYFLIPLVMNYFATINGKQLLKEPYYLNFENKIGSFEDFVKNGREHLKFKEKQNFGNILQIDYYGLPENNKDFNYNYALSSWIYLFNSPPNERESNNEFTTILDYGGKPNLSFNPSNNKLRVSCKINDKENRILYETDKIRLQRWNNITLNFVKGTLDIFINAELVSSSKNVVPYMEYDDLKVGQNEGINGSICNVMYYPEYLDRQSLKFHFNSLKNMKLPIL